MKELEIKNGATVAVENGIVTIKGKHGSTTKKLDPRLVSVKVDGSKVIVSAAGNKKLQKKAALAEMAFSTEIRDAIQSVTEGIERKMTVVFAHFPMSISVTGKDVVIKNIFGEKVPRIARIVGDSKVQIKGQDVTVTGADKYDVGQTMANIRIACKARGQDSRVFQDGIYPAHEE